MKLLDIPGVEQAEEIGRGARGIVYRARRAGHTVAVKVALDPQADLKEARLWFCREGAILACVNHPGLAEILEVGEVDGRPYLIREYVAGRTLAADLQDGPLPLPRLVGMARVLAGALAQVHRHGLVHRDVKPQNIILPDDQAGAKLIDFGLATRFDGQVGPEVVGTFLYSAPEQSGMLKRPVDGRADLYALGVVLFEAATGQVPFSGDDVAETIRAHAVVPPPDLRKLAQLPELLCQIIEKLLAKDPDDRYQTGDGLNADLELLLGPSPPTQLGTRDPEAPTAFEPRWAGRDDDLAQLLELWSQALRGRSGLALIEGEPGSGKSRLVREFYARIEPSSPLIMSARCTLGDAPLRPLRMAVEAWLERLERLPKDQAREAAVLIRMAAGDAGMLVGRLSPRLAAHFTEEAAQAEREEVPEPFYQAVADWFLRLADAHSAALFHLDDVHWIDEASREIVRRVLGGMGSQPLLVLGCTRDDEESLHSARLLLDGLSPRPLRIVLAPLSQEAVGRLVSSHLGGRSVDPSLVRLLTVRTRGNPFFVGEYIRAMLEGGLLRPRGGQWAFDAEGMDRLPLASNVLDLVLERLTELSVPTRALLELAAVWGQRNVELQVLNELSGGDVSAQIGQASELRLLERTEGGHYALVHDRVREALLAGLPAPRLRELHRRLGEYLDRNPSLEAERVYARARHLALGEAAPERIHATNLEAGRVALANFAFDQAYQFLTVAGQHGPQTADLRESLARVCLATNRLEEAAEHLTRALEQVTEPVVRARLWEQLSMVCLSQYHITEARYQIRRAFAEIGKAYTEVRGLRRLTTLARVALFMALDAAGIRRAPAPQDRERLQIQARLLEQATYVHWFEHDIEGAAADGTRQVLSSLRLGRSRELVRAYAKAAYFGGLVGRPWLVERYVARGEALARELADPVALAHISLFHGLSLHQLGQAREAEARLRRQLEDPGRWLEALDFSLGCTALITSLLVRGHTREAGRWVERALQRQQVSAGRQSPIEKLNLHCHLVSIHSFLGRPLEAGAQLELVRRQLPEPERIRDLATNLYSFTIHMHLEQGELGGPLDEAIARFAALPMQPAKIPLNRRHGYLFWAYARLAQGDALRLRQALGPLRQAATVPMLRCHLLVLEGGLLRLEGRLPLALHRLAEAELSAAEVDSPWAMLEIACERARALSALGNRELAERQGGLAVGFAEELGWVTRARRLRAQLLPAASSAGSAHRSTGGARSRELARPERHLDALVQVSLSSGSVLNVNHQARVCLDEMIRLLGAERGFLFLTNEDSLELMCGRDATGGDLPRLAGYSKTVVEEVRVTRQPLVVSGTDEGQALGSHSVVALGLRSILAAPLTVRGRLIGIAYLDNRLARGVFSEDDIGIAVALCNQIAIALENARAAALEASLVAERQQRDLAESVRDLTSVLSSTLDFPEVLSHLLESLEKTVGFLVGRALQPEGEHLACLVERGEVGSGSPLPLPLLADVVRDPRPVFLVDVWRDDRFEEGAGKVRAWLAVPVLSRGEVAVVIVLEHATPGFYSEPLAELALTFCGQAGVALENARLFAQVQKLATTDELTGLFNRRHFFELARAELSRAVRHGLPLSAMLLDVDRFKSVNDTHGHAAGDQVLRQVAAVCRETLRAEDVVGRYGGEEFAVLLPATGLGEAASILAERLRAALEGTVISLPSVELRVTASIGVAELRADEDLATLLNRADAALYEAKGGGTEPGGEQPVGDLATILKQLYIHAILPGRPVAAPARRRLLRHDRHVLHVLRGRYSSTVARAGKRPTGARGRRL